jgi:long-chain fatty acid transport protein
MQIKKLTAFMALATLTGAAQATDGYFSHGYGMKAMGMAGAATAMADDTFGGANNPASMAFVGDRLDVGIDLFSPRRSASRTGLGPLNASVDSDSDYFLIPEFGYNKMLNQNLSLGVSVYGNGGMNTNYPGGQINCGGGPANLLCGSGKLGVNLVQLVIAPTAAYKIAPDHAIGISPLIGYQRFKAYGLQAFQSTPPSSSPSNVTNNGYDDSFGFGVRVGYQGKIAPTLTLGAAYASKMSFNEYDKYKGLFAEQGGFDIPENYNLGVAWQASPQVLVALDYQRINYSQVASVGNPVSNLFAGNLMGTNNGPGFGWDDANVWKLGAEYKYNNQWTFRAGYNRTDNPISGSDLGEVTLNILAPAVIKDHGTLGVTYTLASGGELTVAYMHAFKNSVSGTSILPAFGGGAPGGTETINMYQDSIGVAFGMKM